MTQNGDRAAAVRNQRRSTFAKTQKRKTRTRSDRQSAFLSEKTQQIAEVVLRVSVAGGDAKPHFKHEGERFTGNGKEDQKHAGGTLKLAAGKAYVFSLNLPKDFEIKEVKGAREVQVVKVSPSGQEEFESVKVKTDESTRHELIEWTNTFEPCPSKQRQTLKLSLMTADHFKMTLPLQVKTYKETNAKGLGNGNPLLYINYKFEPTMQLKYNLVRVTHQ